MIISSTTREFRLNGKELSYLLVKRKGQKHIRLKIGTDGLITVSAPHGAPLGRIDRMLEEKKGWIQKHLEYYSRQADNYDPLKRIPYFGEWFSVEHSDRKRKGTVTLDKDDKSCRISSVSEDPRHLRELLKRRFMREAKEIVPPLVRKWSDQLRIRYTSVSIRNQKTRWGSSSGKGHISINWRIVCTPRKVQEYLVVHELLHQKMHNHSKIYWKELERIFPGAAECDRWLKQHHMIMSILKD